MAARAHPVYSLLEVLIVSTQAQTLANQANSKLSTGPTSKEGKTASSQNNFRHGLSGSFSVLASEDRTEFNAMQSALIAEHQPSTMTENILVEKMAQSYWLRQRALHLQNSCFTAEPASPQGEKQLALYLRYQTTHDRAFHQALSALLKLRADKHKAENGFVSQEHKRQQEIRQQEDHARKLAVEKRKQALHELDLILAEAKLDHQILLNRNTQPVEDRASFDLMRHVLVRKAA